MRKPPCKDCTERYLACHDKCDKYKEWKNELEERKKKNPFDYTYRSTATNKWWNKKGRYKKNERFVREKH